jgi:hypothetical protein
MARADNYYLKHGGDNMRRFALALLIASLLGVAGVASAGPAKSNAPAEALEVMTQNQYLGADIAPLIGAIGTDGFNAAVVKALEQISDNQTVARVTRLAGQFSDRKPHLVGLQEVWKFTCIPAVQELAGYPCNDPAIAGAFNDHLAITTGALGSSYKVAAIVQNFTIESYDVYPGIPFFFNGVPAFLQVMDRDVILARADVTAEPYAYPCPSTPGQPPRNNVSVDGCNYVIDLPLGALGSVRRGFVAVDATVGSEDYRFVNTHLEVEAGGPIPGEIQAAQAYQLLDTVTGVPAPGRRLVIVGDLNSSPNDPPSSLPTPYMLFTAYQMYDAWLLRPGNVAGLSCCQAEDLLNRESILYRRVDLIFTQQLPARVRNVRLIGEVAADRLAPPGRGLWPSDHSSVAAGLQY